MTEQNSEAVLQEEVADYLRWQYPHVLFHSDFGSGTRLTYTQRNLQFRQQGGRRAWPDMFVAETRPREEGVGDWGGLFLELKRDGTRILKKDGTVVADPHLREQMEVLESLNSHGYRAYFAVGFDEAKKAIDDYLGAGHVI